jgi:DNA polymerase-3 subunit gamma/tau
MLGVADKARVVDLFEAAMAGEIARALGLLDDQYNGGADPAQIILELAEFTHLVTRIKVAPDTAGSSALTPEESRRGQALAERLSVPVLSRAWQILAKGVEELRGSQMPLAAADMILVRLAHAAELPTLDEALRRLGQGAGSGTTPTASGAPAQPSRGPALSSSTRGGAPALVPAREPAASPTPAPAGVAIADFPALVALAGEKRDIALKIALEREVRLVRFEPGRLEFELAPGGSAQLAQNLMQRLQLWTGRRWMVSLVASGGRPTLAEQRETAKRERLGGLEADPVVASVLARFPGAQIVAVRGKDVDAGAAPPDAEIGYNDATDPDED